MAELGIAAAIFNLIEFTSAVVQAVHSLTDSTRKRNRDGPGDIENQDVELQLEINLQKLSRWQSLWIDGQEHEMGLLERLWGQSGCRQVANLLSTLVRDCSELKESVSQLGGDQRNSISKCNIKRLRKLLLRNHWHISKTNGQEIRSKVLHFSNHVEQLWTVSELSFRSHIFTYTLRPSKVNHDEIIEILTRWRAESVALYYFWASRKLDFDLSVDLFSSWFGTGTRLGRPIYYHLFNRNSGISTGFRELLVEPIAEPEVDSVRHLQMIRYDEYDSHGADPACDRCHNLSGTTQQDSIATEAGPGDIKDGELDTLATISGALCLASSATGLCSFYRVTVPSRKFDDDMQPEVLSAILENGQRCNRLPLLEKFQLAYKIVECGLFLIGTPWLSHLSSDTLRRIVTPDVQRHYVLRIRNSELPKRKVASKAVMVGTQIHQIGILLVEIALDRPSFSTESEGLKIGPDTIPYVERSMGQTYKQACEFCLTQRADGGLFLDTTQPTYSKGGDLDLNLILKEYYAEVFMRLDDVRRQYEELPSSIQGADP